MAEVAAQEAQALPRQAVAVRVVSEQLQVYLLLQLDILLQSVAVVPVVQPITSKAPMAPTQCSQVLPAQAVVAAQLVIALVGWVGMERQAAAVPMYRRAEQVQLTVITVVLVPLTDQVAVAVLVQLAGRLVLMLVQVAMVLLHP
mgnify:FL=1